MAHSTTPERPKTSVRQMAPSQLRNIRQMFESKSDSTGKLGSPEKSVFQKRPQLTQPRPLSSVTFKSDVTSSCMSSAHTGGREPTNFTPVIRTKIRAKSDVPDTVADVVKAVNMMKSQGTVTPKPRETSPGTVTPKSRETSPRAHTRNASMGTIKLASSLTSDQGATDIVSKRTKMFEFNDHTKQIVQKQTNAALRPTPSIRPRSRPTSGSSDGDSESPGVYCSPWDLGRNPLPPPPPRKPPRTGAHDDYLELKVKVTGENIKEEDVTITPNLLYESIDEIPAAKLEVKEKSAHKEKITSKQQLAHTDKPAPIYRKIETVKGKTASTPASNMEDDNNAVFTAVHRPKKPLRPPPPRSRPISIAADNVMDFSFEKQSKDQNKKPTISNKLMSPNGIAGSGSPFYEDIRNVDLDDIKHWDLPVTPVKRNMLRRSMSAECVNDAKDDMLGEAIYVDPVPFRDDTNYDIYVDAGGYAVPYRHRQLQQTQSMEGAASPGCRPLSEALRSKFGGLKKKFMKPSESSDKKKQDDTRSTKKKLESVRVKINLAFAVIRAMQQKSEDGAVEDDTPEQAEENDSLVDVSEIVKRKEHCSLVRRRTMKSVRKSRTHQTKIYPQMFDYGMIVGLEEKTDEVGYKAKVLYKFPDMAESNVSVPEFCFPDAAEFDVKSASPAAPSESYSFVLTNVEGGRVYGYCRRLVPLETPAGLPEVICIISPIGAFSLYKELLDEIEQRRQHSLYQAQEMIAASFGRPMPSPGDVVHIRFLDEHGEMNTMFLARPTDTRIDNAKREVLLAQLGVDKLLKIFACILLERSVLLCAKNLSTLSQIIHALTSLLYPFHWQHVYIPVLPESMLEVCCSPTPYLIGILSTHLPRVQALPLSEIVIFDLNKKQMIKSLGDEGTLIPKLIQKAMKTALSMCKNDSDSFSSQNLMIAEVFLRFFVEAIGHFADHINLQQDGQRAFVKESFIQDAPSESIQQFLEWFTETQMFEVFITHQVEKTRQTKTMELFTSRILESKEEEAKYRKDRNMAKTKKKKKKLLQK